MILELNGVDFWSCAHPNQMPHHTIAALTHGQTYTQTQGEWQNPTTSWNRLLACSRSGSLPGNVPLTYPLMVWYSFLPMLFLNFSLFFLSPTSPYQLLVSSNTTNRRTNAGFLRWPSVLKAPVKKTPKNRCDAALATLRSNLICSRLKHPGEIVVEFSFQAPTGWISCSVDLTFPLESTLASHFWFENVSTTTEFDTFEVFI